MAGKRPDQYQIDPSEGGATDYKFNPQSRPGQSGGDMTELRQGDKQRLADSQSGGQPFMPDVPSPSAEANRAMKAAQGQLESEGTTGAADSSTGKENPLV